MKKWIWSLLALTILTLTAFDFNKEDKNFIVTDANITIIEPERILRYDFKIKNTGDSRLDHIDYPGHDHIGINLAVRPDKKLTSLMVMEKYTKYRKMQFRGGGGGALLPGKEASFHLEYKIKNDAELKRVKENALGATLLILNGTNTISEIHLSKFK
ncbi:hypothetical protein [Alkalihalobacillus sp. AL-G]|uniref:hypothetical protein n=1 Tax=Alkalihalobacillus sp. AL-G TaxID=2926399 RepID=UPI002729F4B6|nr:hypothetical protein [Alkalihalobacillus sp. AL-G]WLD94303.1 hypothetical protein MOJ78_05260 [Alkalihalobacillus sp. AL-G]